MAQGLQDTGLRLIRTQPYTPRTNGKAERFIQTLWGEALAPCYLGLHDKRICEMVLGGLNLQQRLKALRA